MHTEKGTDNCCLNSNCVQTVNLETIHYLGMEKHSTFTDIN